jgi:F-type H+-transporting ATPase subunit alpha
MSNNHFDFLVKSGKPVGEVIAVDKFHISVRGLQPVNSNALILFDDGSKGVVQHILENKVEILHLGASPLKVGAAAVVQHEELVCKVGKDFMGRVISVTGEPLDGKGAIAASDTWPVFNDAPPIYKRKLLDTQLETGITVLDSLFPLVLGQRLAILGDNKAGKTSISNQIAINQKGTDRVVIYVMIAKRRADVDTILTRLENNGAMKNCIVIVSTVFESLAMSFLAPYIGAAMGEYFWQEEGRDTIVIYDDLTSHAMAYREMSLLASASPGRDSYPGDMFYRHSSLLERAGRLEKNGKTLTCLPVVTAFNGDITAYLPTNIMSITDGQWILDMDIFRSGVRPAINPGLSVTRVGGVGHNARQKDINVAVMKLLAAYRQAIEYSRFGSELSAESQAVLVKGKMINSLMTQAPGDFASLMAQQLMMQLVLDLEGSNTVDIEYLKSIGMEFAAKVDKDGGNFDKVKADLLATVLKGAPAEDHKKSKQDYVSEQLEKDKAEAERRARSDE